MARRDLISVLFRIVDTYVGRAPGWAILCSLGKNLAKESLADLLGVLSVSPLSNS